MKKSANISNRLEQFRNRRKRFRIQARNGTLRLNNQLANKGKNNRRRIRFNFRRTNNRRSNNNNQKINKIKEDISTLTEKMNKLSVTNTKLINKFQTKKEMRTDKLISAMDMAKYSNKIPFYKPALKTLTFDIYNQVSIVHTANKSHFLFWFPYCYPKAPEKVNIWNNANWVPVNKISTMLWLNTTDTTMGYAKENSTEIGGDVRLVAATMKITNTTPSLTKEGSYTTYLSTANTACPIAYSSTVMTFPGALLNDFENITIGNMDLLSTKMLFSASDIGYIDEYGVRQGNTIFGSSNEYIGSNFTGYWGKLNREVATPMSVEDARFNPNGININYIIKFPPTSNTQNYVIETWCVWEVVPSEASTLGVIAQFPDKIFDEDVRNVASEHFPFHK